MAIASDGAGGQRDRRRLGVRAQPRRSCRAKRQASLAPSGGSAAPASRTETSKRSPARTAVRGARAMTSHGPLQVGQPLGEGARAVANVHEAVRLPLHVVELGDHIAGDRPLPAQRLDLALERAILELLRRVDEAVDVAEDRREPGVAKARLDPVRIGGAEVPVVPAFEPPRLAAVRLQDLARMGQPPDAELRADQRLVAAPLSIAMRRPGPGRAARRRRARSRRRPRSGAGKPLYQWKSSMSVLR